MNKYEEFLKPYTDIYNEFMDFYNKKREEAQNKIDALIADWGKKHPECVGFYVFRCELHGFGNLISPDSLKERFDYFHSLDEKRADQEFDEAVKLV